MWPREYHQETHRPGLLLHGNVRKHGVHSPVPWHCYKRGRIRTTRRETDYFQRNSRTQRLMPDSIACSHKRWVQLRVTRWRRGKEPQPLGTGMDMRRLTWTPLTRQNLLTWTSEFIRFWPLRDPVSGLVHKAWFGSGTQQIWLDSLSLFPLKGLSEDNEAEHHPFYIS